MPVPNTLLPPSMRRDPFDRKIYFNKSFGILIHLLNSGEPFKLNDRVRRLVVGLIDYNELIVNDKIGHLHNLACGTQNVDCAYVIALNSGQRFPSEPRRVAYNIQIRVVGARIEHYVKPIVVL